MNVVSVCVSGRIDFSLTEFFLNNQYKTKTKNKTEILPIRESASKSHSVNMKTTFHQKYTRHYNPSTN